jgi:hypothetical protein
MKLAPARRQEDNRFTDEKARIEKSYEKFS